MTRGLELLSPKLNFLFFLTFAKSKDSQSVGVYKATGKLKSAEKSVSMVSI